MGNSRVVADAGTVLRLNASPWWRFSGDHAAIGSNYRALFTSDPSFQLVVAMPGGRWEIEEELGSGAFATVYAATCRRSGMRVVAKVVDKQHA